MQLPETARHGKRLSEPSEERQASMGRTPALVALKIVIARDSPSNDIADGTEQIVP